jgi:DNA-binding FrmR family transcriptional regulator
MENHEIKPLDHTHDHTHKHSQEKTKAIVNRLARAIGHLESVKEMVETDEDCTKVLIQLAAVRSAINNAGKEILKEHIDSCITDALAHGDHDAIKDLNDAIDKFMK